MPKKITLPAFLKKRLEESDYDAVVSQALKDFGKWFADESKQTFFPDYTNHGIQHIEQVLDTATNLIPDKAREYFSAADAAALILAVLLHDSALHVSKAGFHYLIKGPKQGVSPYVPVARFDSADWGQAWSEFMFLARRWDDQMLLNVFGPEEGTDAPRAQVRDPFDHWSNLSETDELLIGEFIRKHHPRLAHEMALHGVPGKETIHLKLADDLPPAWRDLVGLIARSHGLPLRTSVDYLRQTPHFGSNGQRSYQNVHAIYLMALLRVADYVQIQGDRTTERIFTFKDIPSLISRIEHKVHNSDVLISDDAEDPESLQIDASPKEVAIFLRLQEWLAGIQQELDSSWAVLGEVYGRYPKLRKLGLAFRRVRSNLDSVKDFAKTVPYVPARIRFDVARAELLKLLIGPLYGDDPSYGVRELMQNSIDAVREYDQFVLDNPDYANVRRREQEADVVVELGPFDEAKGYAVMTISDRGIGMTEATIRDYFLRAGASHRQSSQWKSTFEIDATEGPKSKVLRSGRFGVGALAAFLIGEEMQVETRHVLDESGYVFKTTLNTETIMVIHEPNINVGTCLKIQVDSINYNKLLKGSKTVARPAYWDWYCFGYPTVKRYFDYPKLGRVLGDSDYEIDINILNNDWNKLATKEPYQVYWSYKYSPKLICNGLFVTDNKLISNVSLETVPRPGEAGAVSYPSVCVIDNDGLFPLNLQRNALRVKEYPFGLELIQDVLTKIIATLFFNGPTAQDSLELPQISQARWMNEGVAVGALVASSSGYGMQCDTLLDKFSMNFAIDYPESDLRFNLINSKGLVYGNKTGWKNRSLIRFRERTSESRYRVYPEHTRIVQYYEEFENMKAPSFLKMNDDIQYDDIENGEPDYYTVESQNGPWLLLSSQNCPAANFMVIQWPANQEKIKNKLIALEENFYIEETFLEVHSESWLLDELWQEHFGKNWIPFALEDRLAKFPKAANFFKERYPQVVPDEAWALLGDKPAAQQ